MIAPQLSQIITTMNRNDNLCQGSPQQVANGFYRVVEALDAISSELPRGKEKRKEMQAIISTLNRNNVYCQGAPQQSANGSYRTVEMLQVIISQLDTSGSYYRQTSAVMSTLSRNEAFCQGAPQQVANGAYRIVEMLDILGKIVAPDKSSAIASCISQMNRNEAFCQGAPQQSANGTDAAFVIVQYIVQTLDTDNQYRSTLSQISTLKARNNALCQGADQQSANNLYRIMETLQVLARIMDRKKQKKIEEYWAAHPEEKMALVTEKAECEKNIREIKKNAAAINRNEEIAPISKEIKELTAKKEKCGMEELAQLQKVVRQRQDERSSLGLFKFALRKEAALKIEEAQAEYNKKRNEVEAEKRKIQSEIDALQSKIKNLEKIVEDEKAKVLQGCNSYEWRIKAIDNELTKER